ncbi:Sphingomyelin phosphodiesterase 2, neutral membrane (Neutral sphingomyelinase) [Thoreauomyces humboldtii]|nr:Sphingomyelin phosphodiesterase 2, neutral membrane (Neutral sphingomyelinase) [Thoreauomyces humboldtii]
MSSPTTVTGDAHPLSTDVVSETTPLLQWDDAAQLEAAATSSIAEAKPKGYTRLNIPRPVAHLLGAIALFFGILFVIFAMLATPWHPKAAPVFPEKGVVPQFSPNGARVLAYNFYLRPPPIQFAPWADYKEDRLSLFIHDSLDQFDIFAMCETFGTLTSRRSRLVDAAAQHGIKYWAHGPERNWWKGKMVDSGLLVMSRYPIVKTDTTEYVVGTGPDSWASKGILYTQMLTQDSHGVNSRVHLFVSHLQATYIKNEDGDDLYSEAATIRLQQFNLFRSYIETTLASTTYNASSDAVLMAGDFNVPGAPFGWQPERDSREYIRMIETLRQDNGSIVDVFRKAEGRQTPTWRPWKQVLGDQSPGSDDPEAPGKRLDYLLQWQDMSVAGSTGTKLLLNVSETGVERFPVEGKNFEQLSDHSGVTSVLRMNDA